MFYSKARFLLFLLLLMLGNVLLSVYTAGNAAALQAPRTIPALSKVQAVKTVHVAHVSPSTFLHMASQQKASLSYPADYWPIAGIDSDAQTSYTGIPWLRLNYPTCGWGKLSGAVLRNTILHYHAQGIRILLVVCQWTNDQSLLDRSVLNDVAQGGADAVQCGNEQIKNDPPYTRYIDPRLYAAFYDLCQRAVHALNPDIPVLLGSLDPMVVGPDNAKLAVQVKYLNAVQTAMNTVIHKGGNWSWRSQAIGLIDSWHNTYPDPAENNLLQLFLFWAKQFKVKPDDGNLGNHLWVSEGTGCFKGCGLDINNPYEVAVAHILTLISDVRTSQNYSVPFFFFAGKDFRIGDTLWPIGVLDINGNPKPLRQDLPMGSRVLLLSCAPSRGQSRIHSQLRVQDQESLLAALYAGCELPQNYMSILES